MFNNNILQPHEPCSQDTGVLVEFEITTYYGICSSTNGLILVFEFSIACSECFPAKKRNAQED